MKIRLGTFNLFQFVEPPYSWYVKKDKFTQEQWTEKTSWIKEQITQMNCDIIGFQEVFSASALKELVNDLGFKYFETVDQARAHKKNDHVYVTTTVAVASKYPITDILKVEPNITSIKKHNFKGFFKFAREPLKVKISLDNNQEILVYICHLKSNWQNEFEYIFTKDDTLNQKKEVVNKALQEEYSESLKQRLCEASSLFFDINKSKSTPTIFMCDLNDKQYSLTIDALTNKTYHYPSKKDNYVLVDAYHLHEKKIDNPHPEQKEIKRTPTSYFVGKGNVLDYIFVSNFFNKNNINHQATISSYEIFNKHLEKNQNGSLLESDHAQVVCEVSYY